MEGRALSVSGGYKLPKSYAKCIGRQVGCISEIGSEAAKDWPWINLEQTPKITLFACTFKMYIEHLYVLFHCPRELDSVGINNT